MISEEAGIQPTGPNRSRVAWPVAYVGVDCFRCLLSDLSLKRIVVSAYRHTSYSSLYKLVCRDDAGGERKAGQYLEGLICRSSAPNSRRSTFGPRVDWIWSSESNICCV